MQNPVSSIYPLAHSLVWCERTDALTAASDRFPSWVANAWNTSRPLVVRRGPVIDQLIPVGIRGPARHLRCAAWLAQNRISRCVTPQQIAQQQAWRTHPQRHRLPPLIALQQLAPIFEQHALCWGITGATGFELASGITALRSDSDLDLNIICSHPVSSDQARDWLKALHTDDCRIDLQLETPYGAVALAEWARGGSKSLLKTNLGPFLVADPWAAPPLPSTEPQV